MKNENKRYGALPLPLLLQSVNRSKAQVTRGRQHLGELCVFRNYRAATYCERPIDRSRTDRHFALSCPTSSGRVSRTCARVWQRAESVYTRSLKHKCVYRTTCAGGGVALSKQGHCIRRSAIRTVQERASLRVYTRVLRKGSRLDLSERDRPFVARFLSSIGVQIEIRRSAKISRE